MTVQSIDSLTARKLIDQGALLVDIRKANEHAQERIPGAVNHPLSGLTAIAAGSAPVVIFHCRSGARTSMNTARLGAAVGCTAYLLAGGIDGWKRAGLPVTVG